MEVIKHDLSSVIKGLDALQKTQLPCAAKRALFETGPYLRKFHAREMASVFRDPVPFTLRSVRYKVDPEDLRLTLSISDDGTLGQTPTEYLAPVFRRMGATRGQAVTTRFTKRLIRGGRISPGSFLVPNTKAKLANTRKGRISKCQYGQILAALGVNEYAKGGEKKRDRYFAIDSTSSSSLQPGIYRAKDETISRLFSVLDAPPSVPRKYDWEESTIDEAVDQIEARIAKYLRS